MRRSGMILCMFLILVVSNSCVKKQTWTEAEAAEINARMGKYVLTPMQFDASQFSESEKQLLKALIEAAKQADEIFWQQTYHGNTKLRRQVAKRNTDDPVRQFFEMQAGPFDRLDHNHPFMDVAPKPSVAGFYPEDMTKDEFESWIAAHPEDQAAFMDPYALIRRDGEKLVAVPYHQAFKEQVEKMAASLREAAGLAESESFKKFLLSKAEAVQTDEYFQTDVNWIDLENSKFDMVIGPFEVYEDELNNIKAAYEASVEVVDLEESAKLDVYTQHIHELEANLPYPEKYKNKKAGLTSAFAIVRDVYRGGDIRVGYQPVAANLPNDPEVHTKKGSKKTFWKNIFEARLNQIIIPIGKRLITEDQIKFMTDIGFFDFVLMHEIAHGIGPRYIHGTERPVNEGLRELYSWIEENKADITGLHSLKYLREKGIMDEALRKQHFVSYLGSIFRTIRFNTTEAHGKAAIVSLNFLMEHGGIVYDEGSKRYGINFERIDEGVTLLANELLLIEAEGDYERAKELEQKYAGTPDIVQESLDSLKDMPIDLVPVYEVKWN